MVMTRSRVFLLNYDVDCSAFHDSANQLLYRRNLRGRHTGSNSIVNNNAGIYSSALPSGQGSIPWAALEVKLWGVTVQVLSRPRLNNKGAVNCTLIYPAQMEKIWPDKTEN